MSSLKSGNTLGENSNGNRVVDGNGKGGDNFQDGSDLNQTGSTIIAQSTDYHCIKCSDLDNMEMVQCDNCKRWYHFSCVGVDHSIEERPWECDLCMEKTPSKTKGRSSKPGSVIASELALAKLEASKKMKDDIAQQKLKLMEKYIDEIQQNAEEFLTEKFNILKGMSDEDSEGSSCSRVRQNRVKSWIHSVNQFPTGPLLKPVDQKRDIQPKSADQRTNDVKYVANCGAVEHNAPGGATNHKFDTSFNKNCSGAMNETGFFTQAYPRLGNARTLTESQIAARLEKERLPSFSGAPGEWLIFYNAYRRTTERCAYNNDENLGRLEKALTGEARKLVKARLISPAAVPSIIDTLQRNFGRTDLLLEELIETVERHPRISNEKLDLILRFSALVEDICATIQNTMDPAHLNNPILLKQLVQKLPGQIQLNWALYTENIRVVNLATFNEWVLKLANAASQLPKSSMRPAVSEFKSQRFRGKIPHTVAAHENVKSSKSSFIVKKPVTTETCVVCKTGVHSLEKCSDFLNMQKRDRWDIIRSNRLCRTCLQFHFGRCHINKACGVDGCSRYHHELLHNPERSVGVRQQESSQSNGDSNLLCHQSVKSILYRIVPVYLYGLGKHVMCYAFIDEGSSITLLEDEMARELELDGPPSNLCLKWTGDISRVEENSKLVSFDISGIAPGSKKFRLTVSTVRHLNLPNQTLSAEMIRACRHMKGLDISYYNNCKPSLIIGLDYYNIVAPLKLRSGKRNEPIATETELGWTVYGPHQNNQDYKESRINIHRCECANVDESNQALHDAVDNYFSLDSFGVKMEGVLESKDDIRARDIMNKTTKRVNDRFEVGLLWRFDRFTMPDSYDMAMRRLVCFENKLMKDPDLMNIINGKIEEYLQKKYAKQLTEAEKVRGPMTWYLPIFCVQNLNKVERKVRLVWDAAAKTHGVALNNFLLKGPDGMAPLLTVLFKFRERNIAVTADIREMFHQVEVRKEDRDAQRFLWRNCNQSKPPDEYVLRVMSFGATCSPSLAQHVKNFNAETFREKYPRAVTAIQSNHYVDDWLDSFESSDEAIEVVKQVIEVHAAAGFEIRNWRSNDPSVLRSVNQPTDLQDKSINEFKISADKVLGMWWRTDSDMLVFKINRRRVDIDLLNGIKRPTKRQILSTIMSVFDPIGLLAPFIVQGKVILQAVWISGVQWDNPIDDIQFEKWVIWGKQLQSIEKLEIPRCYLVSNSTNASYDLHVFCDAGGDAHAACVYLRCVCNGEVHVNLITSKTRVNPKQIISVPRLELLAAVLAARLAKTVIESHTLKFDNVIMWCDSTTVLNWLHSDARKFKQFVAYRICECLELTESKQWRYVPTNVNVADEATKLSLNKQLDGKSSRWLKGPEFLWHDAAQWPRNVVHTKELNEIRPYILFNKSSNLYIVTPNLNKFSKWPRLYRTQAYIERAIFNFKRKRKDWKTGPLKAEEIRAAKYVLFKRAQFDAFPNEVSSLLVQPEKYIESASVIFKYSPYLDQDGVLRMKGRLDRSKNCPTYFKRPVILPTKHSISHLIVNHYHQAYLHQNHEYVINEIRQRYVIPRLRVMYQSLKRNCFTCRVKSSTPNPPIMACLPADRTESHIRPFTNVGLDLFGPLEITIGRRHEKRWGALYTCLSIRAIHLELVDSLSTDSCIRSLTRFMARRGTPRRIYCDNATNFRGANNALAAELRKLEPNKLVEKFANIEWRFIPPGAPHFGGGWERLIRTVKSNLYTILKEKHPSEEVLRTCLCEAEAIVNTRPLTHIPIDAEEAEALTPNHFIHGCSSGYKPLCEVGDIREPTYKDWKFIQHFGQQFWRRFIREYLPEIARRTKWYVPVKPLAIGDLVFIVDENSIRGSWQRGRIIDVIQGPDKQVRSAVVQTAAGIYTRPATKLAKLDVEKGGQPESPPVDQGGEC